MTPGCVRRRAMMSPANHVHDRYTYWTQKSLPYHTPYAHSYKQPYDVNTANNNWSYMAAYGGSAENSNASDFNTPTIDRTASYTVAAGSTANFSDSVYCPPNHDSQQARRQQEHLHAVTGHLARK